MSDYLKRYRLTLTTVGPVHIGSGQSFTQKEFVVGDNRDWVEIPDPGRLMAFINSRGKASKFEDFMLDRDRPTERVKALKEWLNRRDINIMFSEGECGGYVLDMPGLTPAKDGEEIKSLNELHQFIRDGYGAPYVPGSSIKGMLRTMILGVMARPLGQSLAGKPAKQIENQLLRGGQSDATDDVLRGLSVSDSQPLTLDELTVCQKIDSTPGEKRDGRHWGLPIFRECLKPKTKVLSTVTVDTSLLAKCSVPLDVKGSWVPRPLSTLFDRVGTSENMPTLIELLGGNIYRTYAYDYLSEFNLAGSPFSIPNTEIDPGQRHPFVYLGAGSGYLSKTLWASIQLDKSRRYRTIQEKLPRAHHHESDVEHHHVAPRCIKLTRLNNRFYEMGKCRLSVEPLS